MSEFQVLWLLSLLTHVDVCDEVQLPVSTLLRDPC